MGGMGKMEGKKLCQTNAKNVVQGNDIPNQTPNPNRTQLNSTAWNCNWKLVQSETVSESDAETFGHLYGKWHMQLAIFALRNGLPGWAGFGLGKTVGQNECHC